MTDPTIQAPPPVANLAGKVSAVAIRQGLLIASGGAMVERATNQDWVGSGIAVSFAVAVAAFGWWHEFRAHRTLSEAVGAFWASMKE
jgi:hypothetical protein